MRITVLSDNNASDGLKGEWGLSVYIEYNRLRILLDAGASSLFMENAEKLGVSLDDVDFAVLSHAHYDHANGFVPLLERNPGLKLYVAESCGADCYKIDGGLKYIGIAPELAERFGDRFIRVGEKRRAADGVYIVPHTCPGREEAGKRERMYVKNGKEMRIDDFSHEQSLVFDTDGGLVIFSSCSHAGASSIIEEVRGGFGGKRVRAIVGGFHLFNKSEEETDLFVRRLKTCGAGAIYTGHCTGEEAYRLMKKELGDRVFPLCAGLRAEL